MKYKKRVLLLTLAAASHLHGSDHTGEVLLIDPALISLKEDEGSIADFDNSHLKLQTVSPLGTSDYSNVGEYALRKIRELLNTYQPGLVGISDIELYEKFLSVLQLEGIDIDNIKALKMSQIEAIAREVVSLIGIEQLTAIESIAPQPSVKLNNSDVNLDAFGLYEVMNRDGRINTQRQEIVNNFYDSIDSSPVIIDQDTIANNLAYLEQFLIEELAYSYQQVLDLNLYAKKAAFMQSQYEPLLLPSDLFADIDVAGVSTGSYLDTNKQIKDPYSLPRSTPKFKSAINPMFAHRAEMKKAS